MTYITWSPSESRKHEQYKVQTSIMDSNQGHKTATQQDLNNHNLPIEFNSSQSAYFNGKHTVGAIGHIKENKFVIFIMKCFSISKLHWNNIFQLKDCKLKIRSLFFSKINCSYSFFVKNQFFEFFLFKLLFYIVVTGHRSNSWLKLKKYWWHSRYNIFKLMSSHFCCESVVEHLRFATMFSHLHTFAWTVQLRRQT